MISGTAKIEKLASKKTIRQSFTLGAAAWLLLTLFPATSAAQTADPFVVAGDHAGLAAQAEGLGMIREHLQHVLNCLEGPTGKDFRASAGNPCPDRGALQTLPKNSVDRIRARKSIALLRVAITLHDVPPAHYVAEAVHAILTEDRKR